MQLLSLKRDASHLVDIEMLSNTAPLGKEWILELVSAPEQLWSRKPEQFLLKRINTQI